MWKQGVCRVTLVVIKSTDKGFYTWMPAWILHTIVTLYIPKSWITFCVLSFILKSFQWDLYTITWINALLLYSSFLFLSHFSSFKTHIRLFSSIKMFTVAHFNKQNPLQTYLELEGTLANHLFPLSFHSWQNWGQNWLNDLPKVTGRVGWYDTKFYFCFYIIVFIQYSFIWQVLF